MNIWPIVRPTIFSVAMVSAMINILMLTGPIFMLQVYDRVLASGSVPTLVVISGFAIALYAFFGLFDGIRGRILARVGQKVDVKLSALAFDKSNSLPTLLGAKGANVRPVSDLDVVRQFLSGAGPAMFFDVPWLPFYLGIIFLFHPLLGMVGLAGAVIICVLIACNEKVSKKPVEESTKEAGRRASLVEQGRRNSEAIVAMGMKQALNQQWAKDNELYLEKQGRAADVSGAFSTTIKTFRFLLQSAVLGFGAWLTIKQEISPGVMIAASILVSRALSPVEQAVSHWKSFIGARQAYSRLQKIFASHKEPQEMIDLPLPTQSLVANQLACAPAGETRAFVHNISFQLQAGQGLGIIGPSGSGKSTLARGLLRIVPNLAGDVRFDSSEIDQWPEERWGDFVGYLPQDIQLFDGTVAENIARFREDADSETIIEAATLANVNEMIAALPNGYNTVIGRSGLALSGGMKQRLALARALYGKPFLIVLDEPNSNLDSEGEQALSKAIEAMRGQGSIVVVIAHRPSAISAVDMLLTMKDGAATAFGPKEEVLKNVLSSIPQKSVAS